MYPPPGARGPIGIPKVRKPKKPAAPKPPPGVRGPVGVPKIQAPAGARGPVGLVKRSREKAAPTRVTPTPKVLAGRPDRVAGNHPRGAAPNKPKPQPRRPSTLDRMLAATGQPQTIEQLVQAALAPLYQQLAAEEKRYGTWSADAQTRSAALTRMLMGELAQEPAQLKAIYDQAGAQVAGLAGASADRLQAANPNADIQANLRAVGAPEQQQQQVAAKLGDVFTGGAAALNQLAGTIPGQLLAQEGASRQAFAVGQGNVALSQGQQALDELLQAAQRQQVVFGDQRAQIAAKGPELANAYAAQQQDASYKARALALNQQIAESQLGLKVAGLGLQKQRVNQGAARVNQGAVSLRLRALQNDRAWQAQLRSLGIQDAGLQLRAAQLELARRKAKAKGKVKAPSASELQKMADLAYYGTPDQTDSNGNALPGTKAVDYQTALFGMLNQGVPLAVAQRYLNQFYAPGEDGRPVVPFQQRQRRKKKR